MFGEDNLDTSSISGYAKAAMLHQSKITRNHLYRPDIDGIRAIAVGAVVVFHAFPNLLPGGFLGVDIFFVISGYLITGIIWRDIEDARFSLLVFYQRRIRRIYPALILVLIASLLAGLALLMPTQFQQLGWHTLGSALFVPNLLLWGESGYFDTSSLRKPLLHLWSLGVEEQFYLAWPVVLMVVARARIQLLFALIAIASLSLAYNIYLSIDDPIAAFYSPFSRAWELAAGAILAAVPAIALSIRARTAMYGLGLVLVVATFTLVKEEDFAGWHAGIAVVGACLLIACGENNWLSRVTTSTRAFVAVGLVSYPLYLWHWPILVFFRTIDGDPSYLATSLLVILASALGAITYLGIERPLHRVGAAKIAPALFLALMGIGCFGAVNSQVDIRTLFYPEKVREILAYSHYDFRSDARIGTCWLSDPNQTYAAECRFKDDGTLPKIAVWGDSHAGRLFPGLRLAARGKADVTSFAADACPPIREVSSCGPFVENALSSILNNKPDIVVLYAWWPHYSGNYDPSSSIVANLNATIDVLQKSGIKVAIIGPFPYFSEKLPDLILKRWQAAKSDGIPTSIPGMPSADVSVAETGLRELAVKRHLTYLSLTDLLCQHQSCATTWSPDPASLLTWDYGHLTTDAGRFIGEKLLAILGE